jgi:hypothetical protein
MGLVAVSTILLVVGIVVIGWMLKRLGEAGPPVERRLSRAQMELLVRTFIGNRQFEWAGKDGLFCKIDEHQQADNAVSGHLWRTYFPDFHVHFIATVDDEGFVTIPKWIVPNENGPDDVFQFDDLARALECAESKGRVKDAA